MKLTQKGRYGLRALTFLAFAGRSKPVQMREVAAKADVPARFLEQILSELKRARLITSKRGPQGGYRLTRHPQDITLGDVLRALDAPLSVTRTREKVERDPVESVLADLGKRVEDCFDAFTVADICRRAERSQPQRRVEVEGDYVI